MKTKATVKYLLQLGEDDMDNTALSINGDHIIWEYPESIQAGDRFALSIPSGKFIGFVISARQLTCSDEEHANIGRYSGQWEITVAGQWSGKQGGLTGGLSGRGWWTVEETSEVSGTFGEHSSLEEYNRVAAEYRARFFGPDCGPDGLALPFTLTPEGEKLAEEFLAERCNPIVGWYTHDVKGDWASLTASLSVTDRLIYANCTDGADIRGFRMWIDRKYAVLRHIRPEVSSPWRDRMEISK